MARDLLYSKVVRPLLFRMDCEDAHRFVHETARQYGTLWPLLSGLYQYRGDDLACQFAGVNFANPVGLAAGFDKNGDLVEMLGHVGFGFAEIGSVTAQARTGNPKPRLFRLLSDQALINRLGLNGEGADHIAGKLKTSKFSLPIGLNIAKTNDPAIVGDAAVEDMLYTFCQIKDLPIAYVTVNASCPNTHEGIVSEVNSLTKLFALMQAENDRHLPILVKLSPDGSEQLTKDIVATATEHELAGYVCGNTSTSRSGLSTPPATIEQIGNGGLSGPPLKMLALQLCRLVYKLKTPAQIIIGCGGIASGDDAYEFIRSGASAVQLYTGLVYEGPTLPKMINQELSARLHKDRLSLSQAIGASARQERSAAGTTTN
ncbi:MAG: quinone-dependent dihydroorotate dehydrogenase [Candidatus Melainabacteria bacterium]|nr:MAG: quinone-dependent dihydroorotate dehydrogenase [Candidatus Melainabacteria bacterium]